MSARVDAVVSRVQTAVTTRKVTTSMQGVVRAMDAAMKSLNLEKISGLMDKFEKQFEDLDVQSSYMENTMSQTTTTAVPQNDVDNLMHAVADEAGIELNMELPRGETESIASSQVSQEQDELTARLARLRQQWSISIPHNYRMYWPSLVVHSIVSLWICQIIFVTTFRSNISFHSIVLVSTTIP